jgi:hypothetical protein
MTRFLSAAAAALLLCCGPAAAEALITEAEAGLPPATDAALDLRNVTRAPSIEQASPTANAHVRSPLALKVKFSARNNAKIDPVNVKVTYIKKTPVDLTERLRKRVTADGIEMPDAEVPPGTHLIRLEVKDSQGRTGTALIKLVVER